MCVMYYASMLRCWQLIRILVRTNYPFLRVGCHTLHLIELDRLAPCDTILFIQDLD
jgi:hypothetical protein